MAKDPDFISFRQRFKKTFVELQVSKIGECRTRLGTLGAYRLGLKRLRLNMARPRCPGLSLPSRAIICSRSPSIHIPFDESSNSLSTCNACIFLIHSLPRIFSSFVDPAALQKSDVVNPPNFRRKSKCRNENAESQAMHIQIWWPINKKYPTEAI